MHETERDVEPPALSARQGLCYGMRRREAEGRADELLAVLNHEGLADRKAATHG